MQRIERALDTYVDDLLAVLPRSESRESGALYITGLLLDGERKSIEPMARRLASTTADEQPLRQRLSNVVSSSPWKDELVWERLARLAERELSDAKALVIDDTGFRKYGPHSVGVAHQYCGAQHGVVPCQVAPSVHLASASRSCCLNMRLYLPKSWAGDPERRAKAGVPAELIFKKKWELALEMLDDVVKWGVSRRPVLVDGAYGDVLAFRKGLRRRRFKYVVRVSHDLVAFAQGEGPVAVWKELKNGQRRKSWQWNDDQPKSLKQLALARGPDSCVSVTTKNASGEKRKSRFGAVRVRMANDHHNGKAPTPEEWLLYEWPEGAPEPSRFWLSNLPSGTSVRKMVKLVKLRWRVERDYQEMKEEVGLDHFEGRTWRGFHHHVTLCAAAQAFLTLRRRLFPPEEQTDALHDSSTPSARPAEANRQLPPLLPAD